MDTEYTLGAVEKARELFALLLADRSPFTLTQDTYEQFGIFALPDDLLELCRQVRAEIEEMEQYRLSPTQTSIEFFSVANRMHLLIIT